MYQPEKDKIEKKQINVNIIIICVIGFFMITCIVIYCYRNNNGNTVKPSDGENTIKQSSIDITVKENTEIKRDDDIKYGLTKKERMKIYYEYCYWQMRANREAGFENEKNVPQSQLVQYETDCTGRFWKIWDKYDENIRTKYKLDKTVFSNIVTDKLQENIENKDMSDTRLSENDCLNLIR